MDPVAAILMLLAGLLHATWHAIVKTGSGLSILAGMGLVSSVLTMPFMFVVPMPSGSTWPIILASLVLHAGYKTSLATAYRSAEFGRSYPIARGTVPLFATLFAYVGLQQRPGLEQLVGVLIVVLGILGLARDRIHGPIDRRAFWAAVSAAAMVAAYSVVDGAGTRQIEGWASFTVWLIVLDSVVFFGVATALQGPAILSDIRNALLPVLVAGALGVISFAVFLWALSRNPIASVVAFRECSVLFATLIGVLFLKERPTPRRLCCAALIAGGLVVIALLKPA
ncbi:EamA family transporter [Bradyrhizobium sp. 83002]|uniref:EamA family transporter n=1 Tax=Bradyrhizobium aeschynomenes TaxID=2734909 RepID=UPI0015532D6E|nr:EamA family transporter [Bradyrhizobium aeschynomenes]NPU12838.1 EamA family transporter [Bradyrhizobium aeschynomenes]